MDLIPGRVTDVPAQSIATPIFLIGSERSGTTLLRLMLDHHPDIAFNMESEFLVSEISASGVFPDVSSYRRGLMENRVFRHSGFAVPDGLDFPALVNDILRQKLERDRKRIVGATVHYGFSRLRYLWPAAKYIYMLRDGRDVASSVVAMGWAGNVYSGAQWWIDAEHEWAGYRKSLTRDCWIEVRYEALIANPAAQLRRICDFIGVPFSGRMFDYVASSSYPLPDPAQCSKWRQKLSGADLRLLEARIGAQLAARGYELGCGAAPTVGPLHASWLQWRSRLRVLGNKIGKFGLWLVALELVSRRLGWAALCSRTQRSIDVIVDQGLK